MTNVEKLRLARRELLATLQALDEASFLAASGKEIIVPLDTGLMRLLEEDFKSELVFSDENDKWEDPKLKLTPVV